MPAALPITEIYAFATPAVKAGELHVVVRLSGGLHGLRGPISVWRDLHAKLGAVVYPGEAPAAVGVKKAHSRGVRSGATLGQRLTPAQYEACRLAGVDWLSGKHGKQRDAAYAHGISYYRFLEWFRNHRAEAEASLAARPITKPSGAIL